MRSPLSGPPPSAAGDPAAASPSAPASTPGAPAAASPPEARAASAFAQPVFRAVWLASLSSNFGSLVQSVGAAWLMTQLSSSSQEVALVQGSTALPIMLFSLWAGAVADNLDRRLVMLAAQGFMLLVSVTLALCAAFGLLTPWTLLGFTFLIGCGTAFNNPAWQASVGDMVPRAALPDAVALNSMGVNIARSVGPAIGGMIVAALGAAAAFAVNAASYVALIAVLLRWRPERAPRRRPRERTATAMLAGLRYVAMSPDIRRVLWRAALFGLAASAVPALMPLVARDLVTGGPLVYGTLFGAFGVGAVLGALAVRRLRARLSTERLVSLGALALAVGAGGTGSSSLIGLTLPALMLAGAGWVLALSTFNVAVQLASPRWVVARTLALYQMSVFGGMAVGAWTFGLVAEHEGVGAALLAAGAVQLGGMLLGLVLPLSQSEALDLDPLGRWQEPDTAVPVQPRTGPVVVAIEYLVPPGNVGAFLAEMHERRRISRRDGAQRWTLLRDLAEPLLWVERYHLPTWLDYVRSSERRTRSDAGNADRIRALLIEGETPRVHRMIERQTNAVSSVEAATPRELASPMTDTAGTP